MHSSKLRGTDFDLTVAGATVAHSDFFAGFASTRRVGVVSPRPLDGLGATALLLAHVTAFYDAYRATDADFFAYPDFFTFQRAVAIANYGMMDVWPERKNVELGAEVSDAVDAITDRAVDVLLVPDGGEREVELHPVQQAAVARQISDCYLYGIDGRVADADITVSCPRQPVADWVQKVVDSVPGTTPAPHDDGDAAVIRQSYRRLRVAEALRRL